LQKNSDFYTARGTHVYFKDDITNNVDVEAVVAKIEAKLPAHLLDEMEMIVIGWFQEFEDRGINAFYDAGAVYVSNMQEDEEDIYDDIVHEISHSVEDAYGYQIYGDQKIKKEFLRKREHLHNILWKMGFKAPKSFFQNVEFTTEFDDFLHKQVGYDKLTTIMQGVFITPYAATSLREYFATMFTEYYLDSNHQFLKKVSPELYEKISMLQNPEMLDSLS
tara:strand:- start:2770 stop:3429 length:660 start_codon:yes stop_codon:yes gene_type:complete